MPTNRIRKNVLASPTLWDLAQKKHIFLVKVDGKPHAAKTYGIDRFDEKFLKGCQYRFWGRAVISWRLPKRAILI